MHKSRIKNKNVLLPSIFLLFASQIAIAAEPQLSFSGFASFRYIDAVSNREEGSWPVGSDNLSGKYRDGNILGLRLNANLEGNLSFAANMVANTAKKADPMLFL